MRTALVLGVNLVLGTGLLAWALHRFGAPALEILGRDPSPALLVAFAMAVAATLGALAWRWRFVLAGLGTRVALLRLAMYRSAGHSLAVLVPSGKVGGDPLRAWLAVRGGVAPGSAIASVVVDRTLEVGATIPFSVLFATLLVQRGVAGLEPALVTISIGGLGLALGVAVAVRRLRRGSGLVTAFVRGTRLDRLRLVRGQLGVVEASEAATVRLVGQPRRALLSFVAGLGANLLVLVEFELLLCALGLPSDVLAVVAATFATGAAHTLPVPGGLGVLEGAQIWLFGLLGYPPDVGLAVGLAARLRDLVWMLPGLVYLLARSLRASLARARVV